MNKHVENYTYNSLSYLENTDIKYRKSLGQYFTPYTICNDTINELKKYIPIKKNIKVLEPSAGAGDFISVVEESFINAKIDAFEIDKNLCKILKSNHKNINIENTDTLKKNPNPNYDLVIGNPPYFETKLDSDTKKKFESVIKGRANIFSLFIKLGLDYLKDGGYLAYVLPSSLKSGSYFSALREYIINNSSIEYMKVVENNNFFHKANQSVMILILKKGRSSNKYIFKRDSITIFSEYYKELKSFYKDKLTLKELGYEVKTGSIVWNENRDRLTDKKDNNSRVLIKSSNIQNSKIVLNNKKSKYPQYIKTKQKDKTPAILVNRIIGSINNSSIRSVIVDKDFDYVGENHINIIYKKCKLKKDKYDINYIKKALDKKENIKTMLSLIGNTQISKTELSILLPIEP